MSKKGEAKKALINQRKSELLAIFAQMDEKTQKMAAFLIEKAAFMDVILDELQEDALKNGAIVKAVNGNGFAVRSENPALKSYANVVAKYNATIKTLSDLLPDRKQKEAAKAGEALKGFIRQGKPGI